VGSQKAGSEARGRRPATGNVAAVTRPVHTPGQPRLTPATSTGGGSKGGRPPGRSRITVERGNRGTREGPHPRPTTRPPHDQYRRGVEGGSSPLGMTGGGSKGERTALSPSSLREGEGAPATEERGRGGLSPASMMTRSGTRAEVVSRAFDPPTPLVPRPGACAGRTPSPTAWGTKLIARTVSISPQMPNLNGETTGMSLSQGHARGNRQRNAPPHPRPSTRRPHDQYRRGVEGGSSPLGITGGGSKGGRPPWA
jgi:hypothetical protein